LLFFKRFAFWIFTGSFCNLLIMGFILEEVCTKETGRSHATGQTIRHYTIDLLLQNNIAKTTLIIAEIFKVLMLSLDLILYFKTGMHFANNVFIVFIFISPLILFTYLFNNSW